jgi:hypothetical protein
MRVAKRSAAKGSELSPDTVLVLQGGGVGEVLSIEEGRRRLDALTVDSDVTDWIGSTVVDASDVVQLLSISLDTLEDWRSANRIIGLRSRSRGFVYPVRQFDNHQPIQGLDRVVPFFVSPEVAWEWLVIPNRMTRGMAPVDVLRDGDVEMVAGAAEGALDCA